MIKYTLLINTNKNVKVRIHNTVFILKLDEWLVSILSEYVYILGVNLSNIINYKCERPKNYRSKHKLNIRSMLTVQNYKYWGIVSSHTE